MRLFNEKRFYFIRILVSFENERHNFKIITITRRAGKKHRGEQAHKNKWGKKNNYKQKNVAVLSNKVGWHESFDTNAFRDRQ